MLDYMAAQNHHLSRSILDGKKPRVPPVYPPLETGDVMVVPQDSLYPHERPLSPSLGTSFTDLMIGDRPLLHKGREGRLARDHLYTTDTRLARDHLYTTDTSLTTDGAAQATIAELRDTIIALRLQNNELSLCLQQERRRREEAESAMERERGYIKRLEENVEALKNTRVVIDPNMYRQLAESYIAARKTPVRRTCSSNLHNNGRYEDLVCDTTSSQAETTNTAPSPPVYSREPHRECSLLRQENLYSSPRMPNPLSNAPYSPLNQNSLLQPILPISLRQDLRWPSDNNEASFSSSDYLLRSSGTSPPMRQHDSPLL